MQRLTSCFKMVQLQFKRKPFAILIFLSSQQQTFIQQCGIESPIMNDLSSRNQTIETRFYVQWYLMDVILIMKNHAQDTVF